jgi:hypothetical protein
MEDMLGFDHSYFHKRTARERAEAVAREVAQCYAMTLPAALPDTDCLQRELASETDHFTALTILWGVAQNRVDLHRDEHSKNQLHLVVFLFFATLFLGMLAFRQVGI